MFETIEQAQRAANTFTGDEHSPKVRIPGAWDCIDIYYVRESFVDCTVVSC